MRLLGKAGCFEYSQKSIDIYIYSMAPFRAKINPDHFGADINILFIITYLSNYFRGGAKKQPVPWPGGPGYNGAYVYNDTLIC